MSQFDQPIPLSLYIHLPWCVRKCPYCDFNSHVAPAIIPEKAYIETLIKNLEHQLPLIWGRRFTSIFLGGGTPSLFSAGAIQTLLGEINQRIPLSPDIEITLEANPGTVDEARFRGFRKAGINRLSIGLQSLQDDKLKALGRIHDREHALRAIDVAINAGFTNFNLDLMHGLPGQTLQDACEDLETALAFKPPHLSWYQLTIEPNTAFHHAPPVLPADEALWDIQEQGQTILKQNNFSHYEISAYAQPGKQCQHNLNYWEFGDYLGIGAGAHSKITDFENLCVKRFLVVKNPRDFLNPNKALMMTEKIIANKDLAFEFMLNALRLTQGVPVQLFQERTGIPLTKIADVLTSAQQKKLLHLSTHRLSATPLGLRFLNELNALFLTD
jgi:putative oxygen-independent coproporphyrinogen III oxidase